MNGLLLVALADLGEKPTLTARPCAEPPLVDGRLVEAAWAEAAPCERFRQVLPREDAEPSERTAVRVLYDPEHLYVGVRCDDRAATDIRASSLGRDGSEAGDDVVRLVLDPLGRGRDGYYFALTAAGGRTDGLIEDQDRLRLDWDAAWEGRVARDEHGWSAEFRLPTRLFAFDPARERFGFNVERVLRRLEETVRLAGTTRTDEVTFLPACGELVGLAGLVPGAGLDFKPYLRATRTSDDVSGVDGEVEPGLDLVWRLQASLTATFTLNTDFADAEVDRRQLNLTRFPLFFPEKRAFFLQDAALFAFGNISYDPRPFYSRRIGLAEDGTAVPILWGAKLTGRAGPWTLGVLDAEIAADGDVEQENLFVGRVARELSSTASLGALVTSGEPRANGTNRVAGADWNWIEPDGPFGQRLEAHAWLVGTDSDLAGGRSGAGALQVIFPNEPVDVYLYSGRYGERYDPGLGFVPRPGIHEHIAYLGWVERFEGPVRKATLYSQGYWIEDLGGALLDTNHSLPGLVLEGEHGDELELLLRHARETLDQDFALRPGVTVPAGIYDWQPFSLRFATSRARPLNLRLRRRTGGYYDGERDDYELGLGWRPDAHWELSGDLALYRVRLPDGDFDARLVSGELSATPTSDLELGLLGQYDNFSEELGFDLRTRWTLAPGRELFFVLRQGYDLSEDGFGPFRNETTLKLGWTWRR